MKQAIVLCSGGLDSVVSAYYVQKRLRYDRIVLLFFRYGQRNVDEEYRYAKICSEDLGAQLIVLHLNELTKLSASLLHSEEEVAKVSREDLKNSKLESDKWYVPCRNLIFLSYALALAESNFVSGQFESDIFVGFKHEGTEGFPDTSPEFVQLMDSVAQTSTEGAFSIQAPLIDKDKEDIVLLGVELGIDFRKTFSCYVGGERHCGTCLACRLRQEGFYWAHVSDPTEYREKLADFRII